MRRIIIAAVSLAAVAATGPAIPQGATQTANTRVMARDANGNVFYMGINSNQNANGFYSGVIASEALNAPTTSYSVAIFYGGAYQTVFTAQTVGPQSLFFQNSQDSGTDVCYILFGQNIESQIVPNTATEGSPSAGATLTTTNITVNGNSIPAGAASFIINPGQPYDRQFPLVPGDTIFASCTTTGDSLYVAAQ
jgi:hypothetical protein